MAKYRSIPDYELKSQVLKTDICKQLKRLDRQNYINCINGIVQDYDLDDKYIDLLFQYGEKYIKEARKINKSSYDKTQRLREKIKSFLESGNSCIWLTLNFNDETLNNTNDDTRRKYVREFLKPYKDYIANIDFGNDGEYIDRHGNKRIGTSREHYHAIVKSDFIDMDKWLYGFAFTERIRNNEKSIKKLPKYITKLTNHAVKESTKRCHIIYSRKVKVKAVVDIAPTAP